MGSNEQIEIKKRCITYYNQQEQQSNMNIEKSKQILKDLLYAHVTAVGILEDIIKKYLGVPGKTNKTINEKLWLISAFYQGIEVCEELLKQGRYTLAAPILRQEYEIITKIYELDNGHYNREKVASAKYFTGFPKVYGMLSELTHLLKDVDEIIFREENRGEVAGVKLLPTVHEDLCIELYGLHIFFIMTIIVEIEDLYSEMYGYVSDEKNEKYTELVLKTLLEKGIIKHED